MSDGRTRKLGIPTVIDRMIRQAVSQVLSPIYEERFSEHSYGFRAGRSAHDALRQCQRNGPLSPLLGNIMLNECDHELERRGHRFVRYADDMMIFCKSQKAAQRTLDNIISFIEGKN